MYENVDPNLTPLLWFECTKVERGKGLLEMYKPDLKLKVLNYLTVLVSGNTCKMEIIKIYFEKNFTNNEVQSQCWWKLNFVALTGDYTWYMYFSWHVNYLSITKKLYLGDYLQETILYHLVLKFNQ